MGITGIWQWILILAIVLILFARPGKISGIMGDFGKGLRNFKTGMKDENAVEAEDVEVIEADPEPAPAPARKRATKKKTARKKKAAKKASRKVKAKS
ncbi:twin-arginine translocase TatA/TatE family subunit [Alphaproteobacteria bacterium LSUCC0684]